MKFLDTYGTASGRTHDLLEPGLKVREGGHVLKASVGERSPVVALARREPAEYTREAVVVVVLSESCQSGFSVAEVGEAFAVEELRLEDVPKSLDLAIGPGRGDLRSQVLNVEVPQPLAEERQHARHPDHEGLAVVAHELKRLAAEFKTFVQPAQDGSGLGLGKDAQANHKARVVIYQTDDPGLEVAAAEMDEKRALDVDVPELVGSAALIPRPGWPGHRSATTTAGAKEAVNVVGTDLEDPATHHLGSDPLRVPVGMETNRDDDLVDPGRNFALESVRPTGTIDQTLNALGLKRRDPVVKRPTTNLKLLSGCFDASLSCQPNRPHLAPDPIQARPLVFGSRSTILGCQEQEAGPFLVAMSAAPTSRIRRVLFSRVGHAGTLMRPVQYLSRNFN